MSFVIDPGLVTTATSQLAGIGASVGDAAAAFAGPTTRIAVAASDEISAAVAQLFGNLGQEFQAVNAQASAFHAEFVRLLSTSAAAYVGAEIVNAEKQLLQSSAASSAAAVAATDPFLGILGPILGGTTTTGGGLGGLLGGSGGLLDPILFGGTGGLLGPLIGGNGALTSLIASSPFAPFFNVAGQQFGAGVSALLGGTGSQFLTSQLQGLGPLLFPGLFPTTGGVTTPAPAFGGAWQQLFINTGNNLAALNAAFAADPFPLLRQVLANQQGYALQIGTELAYAVQNPSIVAQAGLAYLMAGGPALSLQTTVNGAVGGTVGTWQTIGSSLSAFNSDLTANLAKFPADWAKVNQAIASGQYNLAVTDGTSAVLNIFMSGFDTSNLSDIKLLGPVGNLFPILANPGLNLSGASTLMPANSVPAQMTNNLGRFFTALADTSVSASFGANLSPNIIDLSLALNASFGLPLSLLFGVAGAPVAALDGLATAATVIGGGIATGNPVQVVGGLIDAPAYVLDGLLNGEAIVDIPLPVTVTPSLLGPLGDILGPLSGPILGITGPITVPVVAHLPFNGLLVPPHALTATVPVEVLGIQVPVTLTLGGTRFGGLFQLLANTGFRTLADSIAN